MANVRDLRTRIRSVRSTQQITRAMYLVSASKMRKSQERIIAVRPYARKMLEVLSSLAARAEASKHPLLARRPEQRTIVVVMTSDKGLCGAFNTNILAHARTVLDGLRTRAGNPIKDIKVDVIGRKARDWFKRRSYAVRRTEVDIFKSISVQHAVDLGRDLVKVFTDGEVDSVYLVYNEFKSVIQQRPIVETLLPIPLSIFEEAAAAMLAAAGLPPGSMQPRDYIYEPNDLQLFDGLLPRHVGTQIYRALLESAAAEQGARMTAMDNATRNATEMIDTLTLKMNKIRQAAITKEILEVVSGAEALK